MSNGIWGRRDLLGTHTDGTPIFTGGESWGVPSISNALSWAGHLEHSASTTGAEGNQNSEQQRLARAPRAPRAPFLVSNELIYPEFVLAYNCFWKWKIIRINMSGIDQIQFICKGISSCAKYTLS